MRGLYCAAFSFVNVKVIDRVGGMQKARIVLFDREVFEDFFICFSTASAYAC